ncbi:hypothetical protein D3C86_1028640 [compost metagenome]
MVMLSNKEAGTRSKGMVLLSGSEEARRTPFSCPITLLSPKPRMATYLSSVTVTPATLCKACVVVILPVFSISSEEMASCIMEDFFRSSKTATLVFAFLLACTVTSFKALLEAFMATIRLPLFLSTFSSLLL